MENVHFAVMLLYKSCSHFWEKVALKTLWKISKVTNWHCTEFRQSSLEEVCLLKYTFIIATLATLLILYFLKYASTPGFGFSHHRYQGLLSFFLQMHYSIINPYSSLLTPIPPTFLSLSIILFPSAWTLTQSTL